MVGSVLRTLPDVSKKAAYLLCAAALALGQFNLANAGPATQRPQPVIIDTDIGDDIDDAFALAIALQDPHLEVIGITTAWGDTRTRALLVRRLLATLGRQASAPHGLAVLLESRTPVKMFP